jgi:hypothetical protein
MEVSLKDFPVALRSEMDDVCRKNYSLSKSIRALRKKCSEIDRMQEEVKHLKRMVAALEKKLSAAGSSRSGEETEQEPS